MRHVRAIQLRKENAIIAWVSWHPSVHQLGSPNLESQVSPKVPKTSAAYAPVASHITQRKPSRYCQSVKNGVYTERIGHTKPGQLNNNHRRDGAASQEVDDEPGQKYQSARHNNMHCEEISHMAGTVNVRTAVATARAAYFSYASTLISVMEIQ